MSNVQNKPKSAWTVFVKQTFDEGRKLNPKFSMKQAMQLAKDLWQTTPDKINLLKTAKQELLAYHIAIGKKKAPGAGGSKASGGAKPKELMNGWIRKKHINSKGKEVVYFYNTTLDLAQFSNPVGITAFEARLNNPAKPKAPLKTKPAAAK